MVKQSPSITNESPTITNLHTRMGLYIILCTRALTPAYLYGVVHYLIHTGTDV